MGGTTFFGMLSCVFSSITPKEAAVVLTSSSTNSNTRLKRKY